VTGRLAALVLVLALAPAACGGGRRDAGADAAPTAAPLPPAPAPKAEPAVERLALKNGVPVILASAPGAKGVAVLVLHDVGEAHDPPGKAGLAHLTEHLLVTAAAGAAPATTAEQAMERHPMGWNAQTGLGYTVIAAVVPPAELEAELAHAAARLGDLRVEPADLERERERLLVETENMFGGMPMLGVRNHASEGALGLPRGRRRGGLPAEVRAITIDDVRTFWARYYRPPHVRVVLAGAFDPATARPLLERTIGAVPADGAALPAPAARGPARPALVRVPAALAGPTVACAAYPAALPGDPDYPAFLVLAAALARASARAARPEAPPPVQYAPLDAPEIIVVCAQVEAPAGAVGAAEAAVAQLDAWLDARLAEAPGEAARGVRDVFGWMLGVGPLPPLAVAQNPYGVAFALGRGAQLGLDGPALEQAVTKVDEAALAVARARFDKRRRGVAVLVGGASAR
jgi:zinc protease